MNYTLLTATGQVLIEPVSGGDYVYATDPETGESGYKQVAQTFVNETNELLEFPSTVYNFGKELFNIW